MSALATIEDERVSFDEFEIGELGVDYDDQEPQEVLRWGIETFAPSRLAICTSFQSDGMALLDMAWRLDPNIRVFTVDTGRLPAETYELMERVTEKYKLQIEVYYPDPEAPGAAHPPARRQPLLQERAESPQVLRRPQDPAPAQDSGRPGLLDHRLAPRPVGDTLQHSQN